MCVNGLSGLNRVHTVFEIQMSYLKDTKTPSLFSPPSPLPPIQKCNICQFIAHMQALAPHTRRRVQTNNCFHPEIKAAPFPWDRGESLCFPLRVFIHPAANNGYFASDFFRESILPLSPSQPPCRDFFRPALSSGEIPSWKLFTEPPRTIFSFSMHPTFLPSSLRSGPRVTESIRFPFWREEIDVSVWGGSADRHSSRLSVWFNSVCKSSARRRAASQPHFNPSTNHTALAAQSGQSYNGTLK